MSTPKSKKFLIVGILALIVVVAGAVLVPMLLSGGQEAQSAPTTATQAAQVKEGYDLYWNLDRALYDGKSEAGMSSRKAEADGYFHVRFFKDGEILELKVADRKVINLIDVQDLMDLVFDENGIVVDIIRPDKIACQRVGWMFYVQSTGGNLLKLNSSRNMDGLEVVLEIGPEAKLYDMSGVEGEVGREAIPSNLDRVIAIADLEGNLTHVFVVDRSEYMKTFEAECQHCKKVVTWNEWVKTDAMPESEGHYQLQNDIQLKGQPQQREDTKVCIDLNGKRVDGAKNSRCYAMFYPGVQLAIMDTSEGQTGVLAPHGTGHQGMGVWVRYGQFHLYGGTIDGSDAENLVYGTCLTVQENAYGYIHGGTIKNGKAAVEYDATNKIYKRGLGGNIAVAGKLVINGGVIENGHALAMISYDAKGQPVYNRGIGGNIYVTNGTLEINGGTVKNGVADGVGGNIYLDGTSDMTFNGGVISGGTIKGRGKNGGSVYIGAKAVLTMNNGSILGGISRNEAGAVYAGGTFVMKGGYIGGGRVLNYNTGKEKVDCASRNVFVVNSRFEMYGGRISGGVHAIDTSATDNKITTVVLSGYATIYDEKSAANLTLNTAGGGVKVYVGTLYDSAKIGVYATTGIFSQPTKENNTDNFLSDIKGAEVVHYDGKLALGRLNCLCGQKTHLGDCDGTARLWVPHTSLTSLPITSGNWFLVDNVTLAGQQNIRGAQTIALDLSGYTVEAPTTGRAIALFDEKEPIHFSLTDSVGGGKVRTIGQDMNFEGCLVWLRTAGQQFDLYAGTLDASEATTMRRGTAIYNNPGTTVRIFGGTVLGGTAQAWWNSDTKTVTHGVGGTVYTNGTFEMYGGTLKGGKALSVKKDDNTYSGGIGGNLAAGGQATVRLLGGTLEGGHADAGGGNVYIDVTQNVTLDGATLVGGTAGNTERNMAGTGGNVFCGGGLTMNSGSMVGGQALGSSGGGNLHISTAGTAALLGGKLEDGKAERGGNVSAQGAVTLKGADLLGGEAGTGGNLFVYGAKGIATLEGGTIADGNATVNGGNIYLGADGATLTITDGKVSNGTAANRGGNLAMMQKSTVILENGTFTGGTANEGGSIFLGGGTIEMKNGTVSGGTSAYGGNVYVDAGTAFTLSGGTVEAGRVTRDGTGNFHVLGTLNISGGTVRDGVRINAQGQATTLSTVKSNIFLFKGTLNMTGGTVVGGVTAYDTVADRTKVILGGDAVIRGTLAGSNLNLAANMTQLTLDQFHGDVVLSNGADTKIATTGEKTGLSSDQGLVISKEADGTLWLRAHTHCQTCQGVDGNHEDGCQGADLPCKTWNGSAITGSGLYCLGGRLELNGQTKIENGLDVTLCLHGQTFSSTVRGFFITGGSTLTVMDCTGKGILEAKGYNNDSGAVIVVDNGTFNLRGGTLRQVSDSSIAVTGGGVLRVDANGIANIYDGRLEGGKVTGVGGNIRNNGVVNIYGGTIQGGEAVNGGNIGINAGVVNIYGGTVSNGKATNGGNVYLAASTSFLMLEDGNKETVPEIAGGQMTQSSTGHGGNIHAATGSTLRIECGEVKNGLALKDSAGNIYLNGTLEMTGGTIQGGSRNNGGSLDKRNLFSVNGKVTISGGTIDGGVNSYGTSGYLKVGGTAKIESSESGKPSLTLSANALITPENFSGDTVIVVSNDANTKLVSGGTAELAAALRSDKGLQCTWEADGIYLRAANAHVHCLCGSTNDKHLEGCDGRDVVFTAWTETDTMPQNGAYYLANNVAIKTDMNWVGAQDGTIHNLKLCLNDKTVTDGENNTNRLMIIWTGSSMTLSDCGTKGTMKPTSKIANGGAILQVAGNVIIFDGHLDGSALNLGSKNGAVISSSGNLKIRGGTLTGGTTAGNGGIIQSSGTLEISGGTLTGGRASRGGNIYATGTMYLKGDAIIQNGLATNRGGNVYSEGTVEISGGTIKDGRIKNTDGAGNLDVRGTLRISDGLITGGARTDANEVVNALSSVKRNIFTVNSTVVISGGQIDGGAQLYSTGSGSVTISGDPKIVTNEAGKESLTVSKAVVINGALSDAQLEISGWAQNTTFATAASGLTLTQEMADCFTHTSGYKAVVSGNTIVFQ